MWRPGLQAGFAAIRPLLREFHLFLCGNWQNRTGLLLIFCSGLMENQEIVAGRS